MSAPPAHQSAHIDEHKRSCLLIDGQKCCHASPPASCSGRQRRCCSMPTLCNSVHVGQHEFGTMCLSISAADSAPLRVQRQPTPSCARPSAAMLRGQRGQPHRGERPAKSQSRPTRQADDMACRFLLLHCTLCLAQALHDDDAVTLPAQGKHQISEPQSAGAGRASAAG